MICLLLLFCCFLSLFVVPSSSYLVVECNGSYNKDFYMFGSTSKPYTNFNGSDLISGYLYYYSNSSICNSTIPSPSFNATNTGALIILDNYNSECIIERINTAAKAGYTAVLTYTQHNVNTSFSTAVVNTGVPIAILDYKKVDMLIMNALITVGNTTVTVYGLDGTFYVITISIFIVIFFFLTIIIGLLWIGARFLGRRQNRREALQYRQLRSLAARRELTESILRHLHTMNMGAHTPLGPESIKKFPTREYGTKDELHDTCTICVDDFKEGVTVRQLPCQHIFHPECIDEWLSGHSSLCPMCKTDLRQPTNYGTT